MLLRGFLYVLVHFRICDKKQPPRLLQHVQTAILCLCGAFSAPSLHWSGPLSPLIPDGTSFNTQNLIPHPSQKEKVLLETRRAKECQRGTAGAEKRAKEGGRVLAEGSDTRLGSRDRAFESPHSDQFSQKNRLIDGFSLFSGKRQINQRLVREECLCQTIRV